MLSDIEIKQTDPSIIFEDNKGPIEQSRSLKFHNHPKHIDISYHFMREQVKENTISVKYCRSENMIADIMTKGLRKVTFKQLRIKLSVVEIK